MKPTLILLLSILLASCQQRYTPKPYGYFRIDFPEKHWIASPDSLPYRFSMSAQAILEKDPDKNAQPGWYNLSYPQYNAKIHLSYMKIHSDTSLNHYLEDCHRLAYTHTIKAESIHEKFLKNKDVFGLVYYIEGNTASSTQFFVTDSARHFLRGALYFNQHPDKDSLAPVIEHLRTDIATLMETLRFRP